jgi:hypothetical protein
MKSSLRRKAAWPCRTGFPRDSQKTGNARATRDIYPRVAPGFINADEPESII